MIWNDSPTKNKFSPARFKHDANKNDLIVGLGWGSTNNIKANRDST